MSEGHQFNQYSPKVIDHFTNPRNLGEIKDADGIGEVGNVKCGDVMQLFIKVKDEKVEDVKFKTFGCAAAIATSSMITEMIKGKNLSELNEITNQVVAEALGGLPKIKLHCSVLAQDVLKSALEDYYRKRQGAKNETD